MRRWASFKPQRNLPAAPDADKLQLVPTDDFSITEYADKRKEFQKIFAQQ